MRKSKLMSAVKYVGMSVLGAVFALGLLFAPKMIVNADEPTATTGVSYNSVDKSLTITGIIVNDPDFKTGIVFDNTVTFKKEDVIRIVINGATFPQNATSLFEDFDNVEKIYISDVNTDSTTNMSWMFTGLTKLNGLQINSMNTSHVTNMAGMFSGCLSLKTLDLTGFTSVSQIKDTNLQDDNMGHMFSGCVNLERIIVSSNWSVDSTVRGLDMFLNDFLLVGGNGTQVINPDKEASMAAYAKIDTADTPGYLTGSGTPALGASLVTEGNRFVLLISIDQGDETAEHTYTVYYGDTTTKYAEITLGGTGAAPRRGSFELSAVAKQINDAKTLIINRDGTEIFNNQISVAYYLKRLITIYDSYSESDTKIRNMAGSILRYGGAAQKYFGYNTGDLANKGVDGFTDFTHNINTFNGISTDSFDPTPMNTALSNAGYKDDKAVTYSQMNLSFDEELTFMMAFKVPSGSSDTYVNDTTLADLIKSKHKQSDDNFSLVTGGGSYIVTMTQNINVKNLDSAVYGEDMFGQDVTPVLYLYKVYNASTNENMKNLAIALYDFHVRAKAY